MQRLMCLSGASKEFVFTRRNTSEATTTVAAVWCLENPLYLRMEMTFTTQVDLATNFTPRNLQVIALSISPSADTQLQP